MQRCLARLSIALVLAGCSSAPTTMQDQTAGASDGMVLVEPHIFKIQSGDRVEVVLILPDAQPREQRYRAIVNDAGVIAVPRLGSFTAADKTVRELERELLAGLNNDGRLRGSVRVVLAPISRDGIFITPTIETFGQIMSDPQQVAQLDRDEHARWQWVRVMDDAPINEDGRVDLLTVMRDDGRWAIARPAHPELVSDRLMANVDRAWRESPGVQIKLKPAAAVAMENAARLNGGRRMLLVRHDQVVHAPHIESLANNHVRITADGYDLQPGQQERVMQLFSRAN